MQDGALRRIRVAFALWLLCLATWSIVIKYVDPLVWSAAERLAGRGAPAPPILWDFWPVAHLMLAALLVRPRRGAWAFGVIVSLAEIVVVVVKTGLFLAEPDWSFQRLSWLVNKAFVLATFAGLAPFLARRDVRESFRAAGDPAVPGAGVRGES